MGIGKNSIKYLTFEMREIYLFTDFNIFKKYSYQTMNQNKGLIE